VVNDQVATGARRLATGESIPGHQWATVRPPMRATWPAMSARLAGGANRPATDARHLATGALPSARPGLGEGARRSPARRTLACWRAPVGLRSFRALWPVNRRRVAP